VNAPARQIPLRLERAPVHTAAAFVVAAPNAAAAGAVEAWPAWPGHVLALVGPEGCGKTHLARVWADRAGAASFQPGEGLTALDGRPVLVEDADRIEAEALFHLINRAPADGGLLLTARARPAAWPCALADLRSRLNALTVAEIDQPDEALLIAVLESLFREKHIRAAPELYEYLLRRIDRSVAAARDIVERLDAEAHAQGRPVNRLLAREVLEGGGESLELFGD